MVIRNFDGVDTAAQDLPLCGSCEELLSLNFITKTMRGLRLVLPQLTFALVQRMCNSNEKRTKFQLDVV